MKLKPRTEAPAPSRATADPLRDADTLRPDEFPMRLLPAGVSGRAAKFQVVFAQHVVDDIRAHGRATPDVEVCGVLVGNVYRDRSAPYCLVEASIRGTHAAGRNAQVTFTSETWNHINQTMDRDHPDRRIVGWYHTHPGFGIFLSEMDVFIHENFFGEPWQVAYVDDPKGGDRGAFVWQKGNAVRQDYLTAPETKTAESPQVEPAAEPPAVVPPGAVPPAGPGEGSSSGGSLDISARLRILQRELDRQRSRGRWLAGLAFAWPVVLLAALFWAGVLPREGLRKFVPGKWLPARTAPADRQH